MKFSKEQLEEIIQEAIEEYRQRSQSKESRPKRQLRSKLNKMLKENFSTKNK